MRIKKAAVYTAIAVAGLALTVAGPASAVIFHNTSGSIIGSLCVGIDCPSGPSFGFDTIRLQENNLRIHFNDTSSSASFPKNDWRIIVNDSSNGGAEHFTIEDSTAGRNVFRIFQGSRSNGLVVDATGIGVNTGNPVVEVHVVDGDSPTLRLEQDGSSGFTPQTWDVAGNETNFFVRDVTGGSKLPFKILPGANDNSLVIAGSSDVGVGTNSPAAAFHVRRTTGAAADLMRLANNHDVQFTLNDDSAGLFWRMATQNSADKIVLTRSGTGHAEMVLESSGDVTFFGTVAANNGADTLPDYVFEPDYEMLTLAELEEFVRTEKHLPNVPSQSDVTRAGKLNMTEMQLRILEKVEELVLYTIDQQKVIDGQRRHIETLSVRLEALEGASIE
ncbi:MAG: hypothetical protein GY769_23850 [bacterium]|nr:hypothetical protein [bacterium]